MPVLGRINALYIEHLSKFINLQQALKSAPTYNCAAN